MTEHQKQQLLDALMYHLTPEVRQRVRAELPEAYAAYCQVQRAVGEMTIDAVPVLDEHGRLKSTR